MARRRVTVEMLGPAAYAVAFVVAPAADSPSPAGTLISGGALVGLMALRRRWPGAALAASAVVTVARFALGWAHDPFLATAWILYAWVDSRERPPSPTARRVVLGGIGGVLLLSVIAGFGPEAADTVRFVVLGIAGLTAAWVAGTDHAESRAARRAAHDAEVARGVTDERLRIARDLHDILSGTLAGIALRAGAATRTAPTDPIVLRAALDDVEAAAASASTQSRAVLHGLRSGSRTLEEDLRALASPLDVTWRIAARVVPEEVHWAAVRIVQEALTNAARHADARRCEVDVVAGEDTLSLTVTDDGTGTGVGAARGTPETATRGRDLDDDDDPTGGRGPGLGLGPRPGLGLLGIRERAHALGGTACLGPDPAGGYRVHVRIPLRRTDP